MKFEKQEEREMESLLDEIPDAIDNHYMHDGLLDDGCFAASDFDNSLLWKRIVESLHYMYRGGEANGNGHAHPALSPPLATVGSSCSLSGSLSSAGEDQLMDEHRLLDGFQKMSIGSKPMNASALRKTDFDSSVFNTSYGNVDRRHSPDKDLGASRCPVWASEDQFAVNGGLFDSYQQDALLPSYDSFCTEPLRSSNFGREFFDREAQNVCDFSPTRGSSTSQSFSGSRRNLVDNRSALDSLISSYSLNPKLQYEYPIHDGCVSWPPYSMENVQNMENLHIENSLIIQGDGLHYSPKGVKMSQIDPRLCRGGLGGTTDNWHNLRPHCAPAQPTSYDQLMEIEGGIYLLAKDQHGCRFLQSKFDEGKSQVDKIFNGIIDHVCELMLNQFGNYLMQKLLDVCTEEQRISLILVLRRCPYQLVRISLNIHGTRAIQKLIATLKTRQQIALVISALQVGFLELITDANGNHVIKCCLQYLGMENNKFIFDGAAQHCVEIATHQHGCCALLSCITASTGEHRMKLLSVICVNGLLLAQDPYGNYVIQYVLDLKNPMIIAKLASQFEGNYVNLSIQKFSSNVVEKCFKVLSEDHQAKIILELLSVPRFELLMQDPFANYVIQSALANSKGSLNTALVNAIRPHASDLRTNPYSKRIFSRAQLKK
ncbi:putative armadillo-like helical, pumilio domain-containing protein [Dioscorea sansibarensis]